MLGRLPGPHGHFVDAGRNPDAEAIEGLAIMRLDTPLYYFNATAVCDRVLQVVDEADQLPRAVLLDIEATIELDVTTSDALYGLIGALADRGTRLVIVHAKGKVRDRMRKVGLIDQLGNRGMYPSERIAVEALSEPETDAPSTDGSEAEESTAIETGQQG
jgi:MFS superfamily sulfate permease-like transporter